jgi:hypothetical protein
VTSGLALKDRVVLVTGASEGLGAVFARAASAAGARVVLTARRQQLLNDVATELGDAHVVAGDVTIEDDRQRIVDPASVGSSGVEARDLSLNRLSGPADPTSAPTVSGKGNRERRAYELNPRPRGARRLASGSAVFEVRTERERELR